MARRNRVNAVGFADVRIPPSSAMTSIIALKKNLWFFIVFTHTPFCLWLYYSKQKWRFPIIFYLLFGIVFLDG